MKKILCETTGEFTLFHGNTWVEAGQPNLVESNEFWASRVALGQLRVLGNVRDEATVEDWKKYWVECDGDKELAVSSFLSEFGPVAEPAPAAKPKNPAAKSKS